MSWIVPLTTMCGLIFWGGGQGPEDFSWWEFSARSYDDPRTLFLVAATGLLGMAGYAMTPWRLHRLQRALGTGERL